MTTSPTFRGLLGLLLLCTMGCVDVTFSEPMPMHRRDLKRFPKSWQGTWSTSGKVDSPDETMVLTATEMISANDTMRLGDNAVLQRMGRHLVLNLRDDEGSRWTVSVARRQGNLMTVRCFDASETGAIARWETLLGPEQVTKLHRDNDPQGKLKEVQLNPRNNRQFKALVSVGATELVRYQRVTPQP